MAAPAPNGFQYAVETVGPAGWVILALLGLVSVVAWSLLVTRWTVLRKARRQIVTLFVKLFPRQC